MEEADDDCFDQSSAAYGVHLAQQRMLHAYPILQNACRVDGIVVFQLYVRYKGKSKVYKWTVLQKGLLALIIALMSKSGIKSPTNGKIIKG